MSTAGERSVANERKAGNHSTLTGTPPLLNVSTSVVSGDMSRAARPIRKINARAGGMACPQGSTARELSGGNSGQASPEQKPDMGAGA